MTSASVAKGLAAPAPTPASDVLQHQLAVAELLQGQLGLGSSGVGSKLFQERFTDSVQAASATSSQSSRGVQGQLDNAHKLMGRYDRSPTAPSFPV